MCAPSWGLLCHRSTLSSIQCTCCADVSHACGNSCQGQHVCSMHALSNSGFSGSDRMVGCSPQPSRARARPGRSACSTSAARRTRTTWPSWRTCSRTCAGAVLRPYPTLTLHRGLQDRRTCVPAARTPSFGGLAPASARGLAGWEAAPPASGVRAPHAARARRAGATRRWCLCWTSWTRSRGGLNRRCSTRCWTRCTAPTCRRAPPPLRSPSRPARAATTPVWAATSATTTARAVRPHLHSAWPCSRALPAAEDRPEPSDAPASGSLTRESAAAQSAVVCVSVCSDVMHMMEKRVLSRFSFRKARPCSGLGQSPVGKGACTPALLQAGSWVAVHGLLCCRQAVRFASCRQGQMRA